MSWSILPAGLGSPLASFFQETLLPVHLKTLVLSLTLPTLNRELRLPAANVLSLLTFHVSSQREVRIKLALAPCSQDVPSFLCNFTCECKTSCAGSPPGLPSAVCMAAAVAMGRCLRKSNSKARTSYFPQVLSQNDCLQHRGFPDTAVVCLLVALGGAPFS